MDNMNNMNKTCNRQCDRKDCFAYCESDNFLNNCKALNDDGLYDDNNDCAFFKTKIQRHNELAKNEENERAGA